jgi:hypothetical protein
LTTFNRKRTMELAEIIAALEDQGWRVDQEGPLALLRA